MHNLDHFQESNIKGIWLQSSMVHKDIRGTTVEWFNSNSVPIDFSRIKINQLISATSKENTIRGIHFSNKDNPQFKIIKCIKGIIIDVVVDLRVNSKTFGNHEVFILDSENSETLMISNGFGHGYQVISDSAVILYALQTNFRFEDEHVLNPFDPDLKIPWQGSTHLLSDKDRKGNNFHEIVDNLGLIQ